MAVTLITGAAGFIARSVIANMDTAFTDVVQGVDSFDERVHGRLRQGPLRCSPLQEADYAHVDDQMLRGVDTVIHLAAQVSVADSAVDPERYIVQNTLGTALFLKRLPKSVKRLVVASSMSVYGEGGTLVTEDAAVCPTSVYGLTKYDQERLCLMWGEQRGIPVAALRFFNCYDDRTEVLTESGFKFFKDVTFSDRIATLNPESNALEYHAPVALQQHRRVGPMLHFASASHDLCVTPDHRMYVGLHRSNDKFQFMEASDMLRRRGAYQYRLKRSAEWRGRDDEFYYLPEYRDRLGRVWHEAKAIPMGLWCEFMGWFLAEGCAFYTSSKVATVVISQRKKVNPTNYARIVWVLREMGFNPYLTKDGHDIKVSVRQLYDAVVAEVPRGARNKRIPAYIKALNRVHLRRLYDAMMAGDGNKRGTVYTTASQGLADDFTEVCLKLGWAATMGVDRKVGTIKLSITRGQEPQLGDNRTKKPYVKEVAYDGYVYDLTVPNHIIYVRRNGKTCWGSNCYGPGQALNNPYTGVLANFAKMLLDGKSPTVFEDGQQTRDFIHVSDVARAVVLAANSDAHGVFNVCTGNATTVIEAAERLAMGLTLPIAPTVTGTTRPGDIRHCTGSPAKAARELGFIARIPFSEGIIEYAKALK